MRAAVLRAAGQPLTRLALWLAADDSEMCTAQRWVVDGGWI